MKNTKTVLLMVLGMWLYHVADNALFGPRTLVRVQAESSSDTPTRIRLMERQTQALEKIANTLDKIERKIK